ncbi:hypothetical protein B296_00046128 [Ensete ventricosum]|uniref:TOD1/MUCI70 glycosyltransferase-like domain-containing protein n=1 Tax=Ensete ventricosum TaxID=4639 RepID=A0A426YTQ2_ENSVE|nr:hypothetical protein B296_00046128 [Ensete ventricosum]
METEAQRLLSLRASYRTERGNRSAGPKDAADETDASTNGKGIKDPLKKIWRRGFIRLALVSAIVSIALFSAALCKKDSKVLGILDTMGLTTKQQHRKTTLTFSMQELVHCGFMKNGGAEMDAVDVKYAKKCRFVVASGIFDGYDTPHQPSNISLRSRKLFCFLMVVDEVSLDFIKQNVTVREDSDGGKWVGIWRLVTLHHPPYDEPRRNGKVPKILTHRLFPQAQYSIWIDGKMELIVDPLLILERYLWRGKHTFAIACHKHHRSIYEEADAIKRRKRYARPLIDLHMKIYRYEGMELWSPKKRTISGKNMICFRCQI